jgi:glutaredoxin
MPSPTITLYGRPDCHLCDLAREQLEALRASGLEFELQELDIDGDAELLKRFLERIPVVAVEGEIVSELWLDPDELRARLGTVSA